MKNIITKILKFSISAGLLGFVMVTPAFADGVPYSPYSPYAPHVPAPTSIGTDGLILLIVVAYLVGTGLIVSNKGIKQLLTK